MGPTEKERRHEELAQKIARPLEGNHNTAILSLKGGIGKTSTTVGVGMTLAQHRGDLPCAIDANPDSGDLAERALGERAFQAHRPPTITDLLRNLDDVDSLTSLQTYLHQAGRLHVLAGEQEPEVSDSLTADEWLRIHREFAKYYPVLLTDCGTGVTQTRRGGSCRLRTTWSSPGDSPSPAPSGPCRRSPGWPTTATRHSPRSRWW